MKSRFEKKPGRNREEKGKGKRTTPNSRTPLKKEWGKGRKRRRIGGWGGRRFLGDWNGI